MEMRRGTCAASDGAWWTGSSERIREARSIGRSRHSSPANGEGLESSARALVGPRRVRPLCGERLAYREDTERAQFLHVDDARFRLRPI